MSYYNAADTEYLFLCYLEKKTIKRVVCVKIFFVILHLLVHFSLNTGGPKKGFIRPNLIQVKSSAENTDVQIVLCALHIFIQSKAALIKVMHRIYLPSILLRVNYLKFDSLLKVYVFWISIQGHEFSVRVHTYKQIAIDNKAITFKRLP